jgi:alpha-aminoadipate carrier protein LysW
VPTAVQIKTCDGGFYLSDCQNQYLREEITMSQAVCPECAAAIVLSADVMQHELLPCPDCGTELEVISLNPAVLERAPEVEEDWGE